MNDLTSLSVIKYLPPIFTPSLFNLHRACIRLADTFKRAAVSFTDKNLSIRALGWANYIDRQGFQSAAGINQFKFLNKFILGGRFINRRKCKLFTKAAYLKSSVIYYWIVCNHFISPCFDIPILYAFAYNCQGFTRGNL